MAVELVRRLSDYGDAIVVAGVYAWISKDHVAHSQPVVGELSRQLEGLELSATTHPVAVTGVQVAGERCVYGDVVPSAQGHLATAAITRSDRRFIRGGMSSISIRSLSSLAKGRAKS